VAILVFRRKKQQSPKAPAATDYDTKETGYGLELEAKEARSTLSEYTGTSEVYELNQDTMPLRPVEMADAITHERCSPAYELPAK
jgi:hypothetical protein